ncbi:MAG: phytoene desaturase family protein, partial [Hasllibacter sp.]
YHSEARGVWRGDGGPSALAAAIAALAEARGVRFRWAEGAERILIEDGRAAGAVTDRGAILRAKATVFAGDPRALREGLLGDAVRPAIRRAQVEPRSHSAHVWTFAAEARGPALAHHNVFFADPEEEHAALARDETPLDPSHYVCFEPSPGPLARFEIIANAPPVPAGGEKESAACHSTMLKGLKAHGLTFAPDPPPPATPRDFAALHPGSAGSIYGRSPHGTFAALARPRATTPIPNLFLAGGGCHPGAGIPMATRSGAHAAEAIGRARTSPSRSRRTATPGGISTSSRTGGTAAP